MSLRLPCCLMDPPTNDLPHVFGLCPFPLASHLAPVHSHSWSWEVESFQGVRTKGPSQPLPEAGTWLVSAFPCMALVSESLCYPGVKGPETCGAWG